MSTKNWQRAAHDAERERDNALAQLAHEQATRREWQTQYQAEHRDYLNDVEADRDRLRDGIKALITMHESKAAEFYAEVSGPKHSWTPRQHTCDTIARGHTLTARDLRALLDGEAKG